MIRVAAVGDIHVSVDSLGAWRPHFERLGDQADVLLLAGDLTRRGAPDEAAIVAHELAGLPLPVVAVLGNHDEHCDAADDLGKRLEDVGVRVLDGEAVVLHVDGQRLGVAGVKGFGIGFAGASCSDFGEPITRAFYAHGREEARRLEAALDGLGDEADVRIALMHYAPVPDTLEGEPHGIWAFLGSFLLGEAVDRAGADLVVHGHAHAGTERGRTPGGVPVRNVAQPVIRRPYAVYALGTADRRGEVADARS